MEKNHALILARKRKGYTQKQLADFLEREKTTVSNWENGYSKPMLSDAFKLAEILETSIESLFFTG
ncbi:helix-turn-helix transcriptional regulator [Bacillus sp. UNCCL81]|uniref:helix-turn-helix transcriptional regulator n=1 Tax=Bacillus sp. UNCCL81 TaxID=1502755 RepID=UPI0008E6E5F0|nr:helix-turn-helix transcriptional regulator [Bacillus sp. UNCCL81]SFD44843.1 DNA-binding transcriptional regulator, XRE-family HTH domain [Bacillus sp. UNCCL81]